MIHRRVDVVAALGLEERIEERRRILGSVRDIDDLRDKGSVRLCPDVSRHERSEGEDGCECKESGFHRDSSFLHAAVRIDDKLPLHGHKDAHRYTRAGRLILRARRAGKKADNQQSEHVS